MLGKLWFHSYLILENLQHRFLKIFQAFEAPDKRGGLPNSTSLKNTFTVLICYMYFPVKYLTKSPGTAVNASTVGVRYLEVLRLGCLSIKIDIVFSIPSSLTFLHESAKIPSEPCLERTETGLCFPVHHSIARIRAVRMNVCTFSVTGCLSLVQITSLDVE